MAPKSAPNFLSPEQVDAILDGMTARDIFSSMGDLPTEGEESNIERGTRIAGAAFEAAAERQGHGKGALDRVRPADAITLAAKLGEVFSQSGPKSDSTGA